MMDRLIHTAHKLELRGGSMREYLAKKIKHLAIYDIIL